MEREANQRIIRLLGYTSLALTVVFIIVMFVCTFVSAGKLDIMLPEDDKAEYFRPESDIVQVRPAPDDEHRLIVTAVRVGGKRGKVFINNEAANGEVINGHAFEYVRVLPGGVIYDMSNGNFSGYRVITVIVQIYITLISLMLAFSFVLRCRTELFSYSTLFCGGSALFLLCITVNMLQAVMQAGTVNFNMSYVYSIIKSAGGVLVTFCCPIMTVFAISLAVSNIVLIRKEGRSFVNMLGLILSALIVLGYFLFLFIDLNFASGHESQVRMYNTFSSVFDTTFAYFEMMLLSACACGIIAAKKKPAPDKTHVIILGCAISEDGTPLPLLRGRIDRAIAFAREQKEKSGKPVKFVPSGGQGSDEVISEAESMRNYLLTQGFDEGSIILEDKSVNTQENMRFSLEKIKADCDDPRIVFSTSGYHVLRSGMISRSEGLDAEGIGSRVKWYFFPNAFVREFVGLLTSKWKQHLFWIAFFILLFAAVNMIIPM